MAASSPATAASSYSYLAPGSLDQVCEQRGLQLERSMD
ncbi:hypothetical protein SAMN05421827_107178 [Pedobacter terrae]|uniref:Uncharacterized protein n=1 Tax=Pedobacter terrae TaxID=405671 RepID=A0A1G7UYI7_9SPHI|nr:hypothetical protein SAMN05421827_107178 [Pedobacter terrae]